MTEKLSLLERVLNIVPKKYHSKVKLEFDDFNPGDMLTDDWAVIWLMHQDDLGSKNDNLREVAADLAERGNFVQMLNGAGYDSNYDDDGSEWADDPEDEYE